MRGVAQWQGMGQRRASDIVRNCDTRSLLVPAVPQLTRIAVDITPAAIVATFDPGTGSRTVSRPAASPSTGYLGFTAATGTSGHTGHVIDGIQAFDCPL
ncbi:MAG: hypothetical protein JWP87_1823 [Labilithrix sp.]|nr:hypothetical protein [Labilithrix sp.]